MAKRGEKVRCGNTMTEAQFVSFVKAALRGGSRRWKPISECQRQARISRGLYRCASCEGEIPNSMVIDGKRKKAICIDHVNPTVGPTGFTTWDDFIEGLFAELDNLQLLCVPCHKEKSSIEAAERAAHRKEKKANAK